MKTKKIYLVLVGVFFLIGFAGCDEKCQGKVCFNGTECKNGKCLSLPVVTTYTFVSSIGLTSASSGGQVTSLGGDDQVVRGLCWSTGPNPTIDNDKTSATGGLGNFPDNMTGLSPNTTYYVRAYATNEFGTGYGNQVVFSTNNPAAFPTVTTGSVTNITTVSADGSGTVTSEGGAPVTDRGVCWGTLTNPTIADSHSSSGSGLGAFTSSVTGLSPGSTYYLRAFATNANGTSYGTQVSFNPVDGISGTISDIDGNFYSVLYVGTQIWMGTNLKVTKYNNGDPITTGLSNATWTTVGTGAYAIYNDLGAHNSTYGKLYNWYAVNDSRNICPVGWHMPTTTEWNTLITYLGGSAVAGGKLKATGTTLWTSPNTGATNSSSFTARPGGQRSDASGVYSSMSTYAYFWTATQSSSSSAYYFRLIYNAESTTSTIQDKNSGMSCRCIKD